MIARQTYRPYIGFSDEDLHITHTFTDKQGRTLLIRKMEDNTPHDTYYIYDDHGNKACVLPPMIEDNVTEDNLSKYAYRYKYDHRNRCIEKILPGVDTLKYIYDNADCLAYSQDGNQRAAGKWSIYLYDEHNRLAIQGEVPEDKVLTTPYRHTCIPRYRTVDSRYTYKPIQNTNYKTAAYPLEAIGEPFDPDSPSLLPPIIGGGGGGLITPSVSIITYITLQVVNHYDNYLFGNTSVVSDTSPDAQNSHSQGMLTQSSVAMLGTSELYPTRFYYDVKGRMIKSRGRTHLGTNEETVYTYSHTNKPLTKEHTFRTASSLSEVGEEILREKYTYQYDHYDRLSNTYHALNDADSIRLSHLSYDALGRLSGKAFHGATNPMYEQTYSYNIRNWLTNITGDLFEQELYYIDNSGTTPCYNGNISRMRWRSGGEMGVHTYRFNYDHLNRLKNANYGNPLAEFAPELDNYSVNNINYDKNGNIQSLSRRGMINSGSFGVIDEIEITHNGNQLVNVYENTSDPLYAGAFNFVDGYGNSGTEYVYDANGNLTQDYNKGIALFSYNALNLPSLVQFANGHRKDYQYDANGIKRRVIQTTATTNVTVPMGQSIALTDAQVLQRDTTDYCGNVIYENGALKMLLTEEGYVTFNGTTPTYHYYLKDHQGNNRVVIDQNENVEQRNHYYPFGGLFSGETVAGINPFKYNGKELDRMHGLDLYDYGARQMDPALGVFTSFDPLAEKYPDVSPYAYCFNNPICFVDPTGREGRKYTDKDGNKVVESNVVVLLKRKKEIPKNATDKQKAKIERQNKRIEKRNNERVERVVKELNNAFANAKNSKGESVTFKFNVKGVEVENPNMTSVSKANLLGNEHGLPTKDANKEDGHAAFKNAMAAVVSQAGAGAVIGMATGSLVRVNYTNDPLALPHEIGHTLGLSHPAHGAAGGLMHYPPEGLTSSEVDEIWDKAYDIE